MSEELTSYEELLEKELETLNTARRIEELLNNLNLGYKESLDALANLKQEIEGKIASFDEGTAELTEKLETAKREIDEAMAKIEEIKPQIEQVSNLAQSAETSLKRLEEINENVIQLEQSIKEAVASVNLDEIRRVGEEIKNELIKALTTESQAILEQLAYQVKEAKLGLETLINSAASDLAKNANAIKEQTLFLIEEAKRDATALTDFSKSEIERLKQEALDEIAQAGGVGWYGVLKECITTKNHALATLASKRVDKDKFDRIGSVINLAARKKEIPLGYVKPNTPLSIIDYAMLYHLSGSTSTDGKTFSINMPSASATDYIYSGKEK